MGDDDYVPPVPDPSLSTSEALKNVHEKHERLLRNRQAVAFCSAKIPMIEKLLNSALDNVKYYAESVVRLQKELETLKKRFEFASKYCNDHSEDYETVKIADQLAEKIKKLQKQLIEKRLAISKMME